VSIAEHVVRVAARAQVRPHQARCSEGLDPDVARTAKELAEEGRDSLGLLARHGEAMLGLS
jgi:hypothetical protein